MTAAGSTMSVDDLARLLGVARSTVYKALRDGDIPSVRVGGRYVIYRPRIERWLMEDDQQPSAAATPLRVVAS